MEKDTERITQINLFKINWEKWISRTAIAVLLILLWFKSCNSNVEPTISTVDIPEVKGTFKTDTIIKYVDVVKYKNSLGQDLSKKEVEYLNNRIENYKSEIEQLKVEFANSDSLKQAELYHLATQLKAFESEFEDDNLKLTINGIIGNNEVKELTPTYTIKSRKVDVKNKEVVFRLLAGVEAANSLQFDKPLFKANVGFQNKKGNILRIGYDTEERILVGYDATIFKIKK